MSETCLVKGCIVGSLSLIAQCAVRRDWCPVQVGITHRLAFCVWCAVLCGAVRCGVVCRAVWCAVLCGVVWCGVA